MSEEPTSKKLLRLSEALRAHAAEIENAGWPTPLSRDLRHAAEHIEWLEAAASEQPARGEGPAETTKPEFHIADQSGVDPSFAEYIRRKEEQARESQALRASRLASMNKEAERRKAEREALPVADPDAIKKLPPKLRLG
jgi:hypothetical protein